MRNVYLYEQLEVQSLSMQREPVKLVTSLSWDIFVCCISDAAHFCYELPLFVCFCFVFDGDLIYVFFAIGDLIYASTLNPK